MSCANCPLRKRWETKPNSFLGRIWKFHTRFCPGWKQYLQQLSPEQSHELQEHLKHHH